MRRFRRFVIGIAEAILFLVIIVATLGSGYFGYNFAQISDPVPQLGSYGNAALGAVAGALAGLVVSAISAALLYAVFEIADNSRESRKQLEYLSGLAYHYVNASLRAPVRK